MTITSERVALRHAGSGPCAACLREPRGDDELALAGVDTRAAALFLDRLVQQAPCASAELAAADRDRLLAALHRTLWGDRVVSTLTCEACGQAFDLAFELSALQRRLAEQSEPSTAAGPRALRSAAGEAFALSSAADEDAVGVMGVAAGAARLAALATGEASADPQSVGARLDVLAPLLDVDLDTRCAECGHAQFARFDIQTFVLQRLLDERPGVLDDLHALAAGYGWSLPDILALPRSLRRSLAQRLTGMPPAFG